MADRNHFNAAHFVDLRSGFCPQTQIFHSLRPPLSLPPLSQPLSVTEHALSLLQSSPPPANATVLIDSNSGFHLSYAIFIRQIRTLASNLKALTSLSNGQVAFILAPTSLQVPVLYFALLSLGVILSPANPTGSESEISHQIRLSKPVIAFATSSTASKLPRFRFGTVLIDSPHFLSMMTEINRSDRLTDIKIDQPDSAAILYSSGATGRVKGVLLSHRNLIAVNSGRTALQSEIKEGEMEPHPASLCLLPLFHVFGFVILLRAISRGETLVLMQRFDFEAMVRAVERFRVMYIPVSPPLVVAMASLQVLGCGGAPLGKEVIDKFHQKLPNVEIVQGYGLTESTAGAARTLGPEETNNTNSVGRSSENMEAKIVDPTSGEALPPGGHKGELWLRGPVIMKGQILKELIKYKAYQVPPAELEHLLQSNPEIIDAAVIPYEFFYSILMKKLEKFLWLMLLESLEAISPRPKLLISLQNRLRRTRKFDEFLLSTQFRNGKILRRELAKHALSHGSNKL
ncbi:unnamed protein product [Citrullus colocynthis]|uniref:AMP-dependent synthetase/ligase domain-containing protein n=1 Tax=Citrullus colocynthis TaxID=252529 RepID=A0ABP0Z357_9ROSI